MIEGLRVAGAVLGIAMVVGAGLSFLAFFAYETYNFAGWVWEML